MERFFLIDYENRNKEGLKGCQNLTSKDHIHIFYTEKSQTITFDILTNHGKADINFHNVAAGSQSLDKHLLAFLGFLIGKNGNIESEFVIISNDTGYDKTCKFLTEFNKNITITRRGQITDNSKKSIANTQNPQDSKGASDKTLFHNKIQQILRNHGETQDVLSFVPGFVTKNYEQKNAKQTIYLGVIKKFGQKKGLEIYNLIKKHI